MTWATVATAVILQAIAVTNVAQGTASQIDEPRKVIVRSADEFQALWKSHSNAPLPKVDFSKSIVVGVFLGMRPTAGYTVAIQAVRRSEGGAVVVEYVEGAPDKSKMVAQMLTSPFHLVSIPSDIKTVEFKQLPR
jgi:hypothetical protein